MGKYLIRYLTFCAILFSVFSQAQTGKTTITGIITDSADNKPVSYVTINLYKRGQVSQSFKAIFSDSRGKFQITSVDTGKYTLVFTHVGFIEKKLPLNLQGTKDLGTITLSPVSKTLKNVQVLSQKPLIEQQDDKIIFNVENDPDSKNSLTLDIFRKTPYLTVDGDDNVLMNGKSDFKVLLDGRETSLFARNVKEALKAFPGSMISRIEVITTPPAKYDAEGIGGIINIVTKKKVAGYNGSVGTFTRTGAKINTGNINFNYKSGGIGIALFYFANGFDDLKTTSLAETYAKTPSYFTSRSIFDDRSSNNFYNAFNAEVSWEIDSLKILSAYGNINGGHGATITDRSMLTIYPSSPAYESQQYIDNSYKNPRFSIGSDFIKKFKGKKDREFSARFYAEIGTNTAIDESFLDNTTTNDRFLLNNSKNTDNQYTIQSDYVLPLPDNRRFETGIKLILREAISDFQSLVKYDPAHNYFMDPNNSDYFSYNQNIYSIYSNYNFRTKKSTFRLGGRLEYTNTDGNFVSSKTTVKQNYLNAVPFLQFINKINPQFSFVFTYSQRLRRPFIWNLNPFVNNTDSLDVYKGNPDLGPETLHFFTPELRFQKGTTFASVGSQLTYTNNFITEYAAFDPSTGVTTRTSDHLGRGVEIRVNSNFNKVINPKLNINGNGYVHWNINRVKEFPQYNSDGFGYGVTSGFNYKITQKISWGGFFNCNQAPDFAQFNFPFNMWYMSMFAFKLFKDKVNTSIRATNFFKSHRSYVMTTEDDYFKTTRTTTRPLRGIVVTFNWTFGKLKENVSKKKGVNNDDLLQTGTQDNTGQ
jgi:hypothetical protein